jgi:hypothetical protein
MTKATRKRMAAIFNEWAKRYCENPDAFDTICDGDGSPVKEYGDQCAVYFEQLSKELFPKEG